MSRKCYVLGLSLIALFTLGSCKSKQSAYKAAYERAKEKDIDNESTGRQVDEITPVSKPKTTTTTNTTTTTMDNFQKESVTAVDNASGLKRFNVVIGSFTVKTNATSLKTRMEAEGYRVILALNERQMYRVIVASFDDKASAASARNAIKVKHYPEFQDAWLLENSN